MTQLFEDERRFPDNATRQNFVFMGYPYDPPLPADDYRSVVAELQTELPVRFWYFLDEITTAEMMRKIGVPFFALISPSSTCRVGTPMLPLSWVSRWGRTRSA